MGASLTQQRRVKEEGFLSDTRAAAAVADATSVEDVVEQFNALLANLRAAGLLST